MEKKKGVVEATVVRSLYDGYEKNPLRSLRYRGTEDAYFLKLKLAEEFDDGDEVVIIGADEYRDLLEGKFRLSTLDK